MNSILNTLSELFKNHIIFDYEFAFPSHIINPELHDYSIFITHERENNVLCITHPYINTSHILLSDALPSDSVAFFLHLQG